MLLCFYRVVLIVGAVDMWIEDKKPLYMDLERLLNPIYSGLMIIFSPPPGVYKLRKVGKTFFRKIWIKSRKTAYMDNS